MNENREAANQEREYPHWNRVYLIVIIYAIALIIGLWAFSRMFQ
jgi:hypothetical protein